MALSDRGVEAFIVVAETAEFEAAGRVGFKAWVEDAVATIGEVASSSIARIGVFRIGGICVLNVCPAEQEEKEALEPTVVLDDLDFVDVERWDVLDDLDFVDVIERVLDALGSVVVFVDVVEPVFKLDVTMDVLGEQVLGGRSQHGADEEVDELHLMAGGVRSLGWIDTRISLGHAISGRSLLVGPELF